MSWPTCKACKYDPVDGTIPCDEHRAAFLDEMDRNSTKPPTKREWFAGMALQGLLANKDFSLFDETGDLMQEELAARNAFVIADAMIAQSMKGTP